MRELCREERKPSLLDLSVQFDLMDSRGGRSRKGGARFYPLRNPG